MQATLSSANLVWLIPALPLAGFFFHAFLGKRVPPRLVGAIATLVVLGAFVVSLILFCELLGLAPEQRRIFAGLLPGGFAPAWIDIAGFQVYFRSLIDPLSVLMCLIVTGVGGLIHLYATGYMRGDKDFPRFFTYLNLFIFFMLVLVLGDNLLLMFVGWEGVGLCSYLLISFWFEDVENSKAGNKAFIVNRIGDVGFALGMMTIFALTKTLTFYTADGRGFLDPAALTGLTAAAATTIGLLLFVGAIGKSAQFPLYVWLPDAMAGPTPVSALIHAATMVTAGVVMVTRVSPLIVLSSTTMAVIAGIGVFTAIFAASIAITQNDIKKVLAYSTISQLGYMFLACGVGAFSAGMFHVTTHAFFKALLFLGAGSVIHAMSGEQDMRRMGGLKNKIPITYWTMWAGWLAICGVVPFAGFWSKDAILGAASGYPGFGMVFYGVGLVTAIMTAFYMSRLMWKTFWSTQRFDESALGARSHGGHGATADGASGDNAVTDGDQSDPIPHGGVHESPPSMWIPLAVLAILSAVGGLLGIPWHNLFETFLEPSVARYRVHDGLPVAVGMALGLAAALGGIALAYLAYSKHRDTGDLLSASQKQSNLVYQASVNLWGVDGFFYRVFVTGGGTFARVWKGIDEWVVDGAVKLAYYVVGALSEILRLMQTGYVRNYALVMLLGAVAVLGSILWGAHGFAGK